MFFSSKTQHRSSLKILRQTSLVNFHRTCCIIQYRFRSYMDWILRIYSCLCSWIYARLNSSRTLTWLTLITPNCQILIFLFLFFIFNSYCYDKTICKHSLYWQNVDKISWSWNTFHFLVYFLNSSKWYLRNQVAANFKLCKRIVVHKTFTVNQKLRLNSRNYIIHSGIICGECLRFWY